MHPGCNVGYAFVNFITVQDLLLFAKTQIGVKWCVVLLVEFLVRPERVAGTCTRARRPSRCVMPRTSESFATRRISPRAISFLRQLKGQGVARREVQELLYHGREGGLEAQDLLFGRSQPGSP